MGLFDGAQGGAGISSGSTADVAATLGLPVILVVDAAGAQAQSAAATVHGFASFRKDVSVAGVIFNRVGSARHADMLKDAAAPLHIPVLGCVPRAPDIAVPDRHLGLVQASEMAALENFLDAAADLVAGHIDIGALRGLLVPAGTAARERRRSRCRQSDRGSPSPPTTHSSFTTATCSMAGAPPMPSLSRSLLADEAGCERGRGCTCRVDIPNFMREHWRRRVVFCRGLKAAAIAAR